MIFQSFAVLNVHSTLKNHQIWQNFGKKWRKVLSNLPLTYFSTAIPKPETKVSGTSSITNVDTRFPIDRFSVSSCIGIWGRILISMWQSLYQKYYCDIKLGDTGSFLRKTMKYLFKLHTYIMKCESCLIQIFPWNYIYKSFKKICQRNSTLYVWQASMFLA